MDKCIRAVCQDQLRQSQIKTTCGGLICLTMSRLSSQDSNNVPALGLNPMVMVETLRMAKIHELMNNHNQVSIVHR